MKLKICCFLFKIGAEATDFLFKPFNFFCLFLNSLIFSESCIGGKETVLTLLRISHMFMFVVMQVYLCHYCYIKKQHEREKKNPLSGVACQCKECISSFHKDVFFQISTFQRVFKISLLRSVPLSHRNSQDNVFLFCSFISTSYTGQCCSHYSEITIITGQCSDCFKKMETVPGYTHFRTFLCSFLLASAVCIGEIVQNG